MRYPTMTRILAIFLALCALGLICAGGFGIYTARKDRISSQKELEKMQSWAEEYKALDTRLNGESKADEMGEKLDKESETHKEMSSEHKRELAEYSAGKSGVQIGTNALIAGDDKLYEGWEQYYAGVKLFEEKEQEFNEGYAKLTAGKAALDASKTLYGAGVQALNGVKAVVNELETLDEVFESGDREEAYDRLLTAYEGAVYAISDAEEAVNSLLEQGLISSEQVSLIENSIIAATGMSSGEIKEKVEGDYNCLLNSGELSEEEFAQLKAQYDANKANLILVSQTIKKYIGPAEQQLNAMGAEIQKADAEIKKTEPMIEKGKAAIEEGRKGLEGAKEVLQQGDAALVQGDKKLDEEQAKLDAKLPELKEQKEELEDEQSKLNTLRDETKERKELEGRRTSLSLKLREKPEIKDSYESGTELYEAAESYIAEFENDIKAEYRNYIVAAVIAALAAVAGMLAPIGVFGKEKGRMKRMIIPALCCGISLIVLALGYFALHRISSAAVTAVCASLAVMLSAYPNKKKKESYL